MAEVSPLELAATLSKYSDDQPRDEHGRWTDAGGVTISADQKESLWRYCSSYAADVNDGLRGGHEVDDIEQKIVDNLDALMKQDVTPEDMTLFRGVNAEHLGNLNPGKIMRDNGFVSTSADDGISNLFGDTRVEIFVPKGTHALNVWKFKRADPVPPPGMHVNPTGDGHYGGVDNEKEVILPRGSRFRVGKYNREGHVLQVRLMS